VQTDGQGQFTINQAPVGVFKLMADGTTATVPGKQYPTLEFDVTTVAGRSTTVGMPMYLQALDTVNQLCVSDTTGGTLTLPAFPGFSLTVAAGSATFPGGSRSGCISATPVNPDKVPMAPGFGQQPRFILTIQPVGTTFNPPAAMTIPNFEALPPRAVTELYSYDHDLAAFVAIGTGTVSVDGSVIASDPGVGVLKAGWHCGGPPAPQGDTGGGGGGGNPPECEAVSAGIGPRVARRADSCHKCEAKDDCHKCDANNQVVPKDLCVSCKPSGSACDGNGACTAGKDLIPKICDGLGVTYGNDAGMACAPGKCGAKVKYSVTTVTHNCDSIDMVGARVTEKVTTDHGCSAEEPTTGSGCPVLAGNKLGGCQDVYGLCMSPLAVPGRSCEEVYTQVIYVGSCRAVERTITFTISGVPECKGSYTIE